MNDPTLYRRNAGIAERYIDDAVFLVDATGETIFHLNAVGTAVWRFLDQPRAMAELTDVICRAFPDVPPERIDTDITKLIANFTARGLVIKTT